MNKIQQQMLLIQTYIDQHQWLPSIEEIAKQCQVTPYNAKGIQRRYMIYQFTKKYIETHGHPPARREISEMLHIPLTVIQYHLDQLLDANLIDGVANQQRGIRILELEVSYE